MLLLLTDRMEEFLIGTSSRSGGPAGLSVSLHLPQEDQQELNIHTSRAEAQAKAEEGLKSAETGCFSVFKVAHSSIRQAVR